MGTSLRKSACIQDDQQDVQVGGVRNLNQYMIYGCSTGARAATGSMGHGLCAVLLMCTCHEQKQNLDQASNATDGNKILKTRLAYLLYQGERPYVLQ